MTSEKFDIVVIGAGMAGASIAAELAGSSRVLLLERESQPGYHTTGRSAAIYTCAYGPPIIRALTRASGPFMHGQDWPSGTPGNCLRQRDVIFIARDDQTDAMAGMLATMGDAVSPLGIGTIMDRIPILRPGYAVGGLLETSGADIDVDAIHQFYLKRLRELGGELRVNAEVMALARNGDDWLLETRSGSARAPVVVNAAGAWADKIAELAGLGPLGLVPKRRTALLLSPPDGMIPDDWPMVVDMEEKFYLKPDAGKLFVSPADETPSEPCDAQPEELDVAICVDLIEKAFQMSVRRVDHKWAGLRSFFPNGCPAAGFDASGTGFFWFAGQGGYGIQSAPALARAGAALVRDEPIPSDIADEGVDKQGLAPEGVTSVNSPG